MNLKSILDICNELNIDAADVNIGNYLYSDDSVNDYVYFESKSSYVDEFDIFLNINIVNNNLISKLNQCFIFNEMATVLYMCYGKEYKTQDGDIAILSKPFKFVSFAASDRATNSHYVENARIHNIFNNLNIKYSDTIFKQALKNFSDINNEQFDLSLSNFNISKNSFKYTMATKFLKNLELLS